MTSVDDNSHADIQIRVQHAATLSTAERARVDRVFEASYEQPNHEYLDRSIDRTGMLAIALEASGNAVG